MYIEFNEIKLHHVSFEVLQEKKVYMDTKAPPLPHSHRQPQIEKYNSLCYMYEIILKRKSNI